VIGQPGLAEEAIAESDKSQDSDLSEPQTAVTASSPVLTYKYKGIEYPAYCLMGKGNPTL
jgi:hypothetical protein